MKEVFKRFLSLSSQERKGVILLIAVILVITCINAFLSFHRPIIKEEKNISFFNELEAYDFQGSFGREFKGIGEFRENQQIADRSHDTDHCFWYHGIGWNPHGH